MVCLCPKPSLGSPPSPRDVQGLPVLALPLPASSLAGTLIFFPASGTVLCSLSQGLYFVPQVPAHCHLVRGLP